MLRFDCFGMQTGHVPFYIRGDTTGSSVTISNGFRDRNERGSSSARSFPRQLPFSSASKLVCLGRVIPHCVASIQTEFYVRIVRTDNKTRTHGHTEVK